MTCITKIKANDRETISIKVHSWLREIMSIEAALPYGQSNDSTVEYR